MLPIKIAGLGCYLPERRVTNAELEEQLAIPERWIERATGVRERRYVTDETSAGMGAAAARRALQEAGLEVSDLDAIIGASTSLHQAIPCTAALVQRELRAPEGASACFDVNATCLSFLFALQMAGYLIAANVYQRVLIYSSEMASRSLNPNERESAVLFGDAAAAAIVTRSEPGEASAFWGAQFETYSSGAALTEIIGGGTNHHPNDPTTTPEMNLFHMDGPGIFRKAAVLAEPFVNRFLEQLNWKREQINAVVPHQGSRHVIEQLERRLGFQCGQVIWDLAERGNCVAASIPLTFTEAVQSGRIQRGDRVLLVGTGAGLTFGGVALTF